MNDHENPAIEQPDPPFESPTESECREWLLVKVHDALDALARHDNPVPVYAYLFGHLLGNIPGAKMKAIDARLEVAHANERRKEGGPPRSSFVDDIGEAHRRRDA